MLWLAIAALASAIAVNCVAVWAQKRHRAYDRLGRWAWPAHIALLVVVWGGAVLAIVLLVLHGPEIRWPLPSWVRWPGLVLGLIATMVFGQGIRQLGAQSLFNGNFFGHGRPFTREGIYEWLDDPMYVAYTATFVALAMRQADAIYLLLAVVSAVGLNLVESRVERFEEPAEEWAVSPRAGDARG
ncbi:methyltransferase [Actinomycetospora sp.]|uniref:methyltransferase n=1 Tax=Actinomycetospora sp. TaxID=1872135 RepID=UPI002F3E5B95